MIDRASLLLLAAGWNDLLTALVPLVFLLIWVLSQLAEAKKKGVQPPGRQQAGRPQPRAPGMPQAARPKADALHDQVEEFLRRAGRQPKPGQGRAVARPPDPLAGPQRPARPVDEIEVLLGDEPPAAQRGPLSRPLRPLDQRLTPSQPQAPPAAIQRRPPRRPLAPKPEHESVAEHVAEHVGAARRVLGEHAAHLGERVVQADHQFDVQLKAKFDHDVGTLASQQPAGAAAQPSDTPARQIAALLADPAGVRQAIVLNEILRRPLDRW